MRKYLRQTSSHFPIKPLSIAGAEVGCMLEYLYPIPTSPLSNIVRLACFSNSSLVSRRAPSMATTSGACVTSCNSTFRAGSSTGSLVGIECDLWFDTIILIFYTSSSGVKEFTFLYQYVISSSQIKPTTLILILYFKYSSLDNLIFRFSAPCQL